MKKSTVLITILYSIMFLTSCTSVKTVVFDVQKPPKIQLQRNIEKIGIVNNTVPQAHNVGHINRAYSTKGKASDTNIDVRSDSAGYILSEILFEELSKINDFSEIKLYEFPLRDDEDFTAIRPIDEVIKQELFDSLNVDAIISLDRFLINSTQTTLPYDFDAEIEFLDLKMDIIFNINSKGKSEASTSFHFSDSIYWEAIYTSNKKQRLTPDSIPSRENAIKQAAAYAGAKLAESFTSSWEERARVYYTDSKEANSLVDSDNWANAMKIWLDNFDKESNSKKKARYAHNIALAHELSDNLREALRWSETSKKLFEESTGNPSNFDVKAETWYYNDLMGRYNDFRLLDIRNK